MFSHQLVVINAVMHSSCLQFTAILQQQQKTLYHISLIYDIKTIVFFVVFFV